MSTPGGVGGPLVHARGCPLPFPKVLRVPRGRAHSGLQTRWGSVHRKGSPGLCRGPRSGIPTGREAPPCPRPAGSVPVPRRSSPVRGRPSALNAASVRRSERHIEPLRDGPFVESPGMGAGDLCPGMGVSAPGCMARGEHGSSGGCLPPAQPGVPVSPGRCHVLCCREGGGTKGHCWHPGSAGGHSPGWAHNACGWRTRCEPGQG